MSFLKTLLYDACMKAAENACLVHWRNELLQRVDGRVLEIGAGTGASLRSYPNKNTLEVVFSEPDKNMRMKLKRQLKNSHLSNTKVISSASEFLNSPDNSFDYVFTSFVCCSMKDIVKSLSEIQRVLKPGGEFIFLEHVAASKDSSVRKWQDRLNFLWKKIAGNCNLNRETEKYIRNAGFSIENIRYDTMRKTMPLLSPTIRGSAIANSNPH